MKWDFASGYSLTAAVFQIEQDIVERMVTGGSETLDNQINGFEAQFNGRLNDQWSIAAGYSYLNGEIKDGDW